MPNTRPGYAVACKQCGKKGVSCLVQVGLHEYQSLNLPPEGWVIGRYIDGLPWYCSAACFTTHTGIPMTPEGFVDLSYYVRRNAG